MYKWYLLLIISALVATSWAQRNEAAREEKFRRHADALRGLMRSVPNLKSFSAYGENKWNQESLQNSSLSPWCSFFGIKCHREPGEQYGLIKSLSLSNVGIDGSVPRELEQLEALEHLELRGNKLIGAVPVSALNNLPFLKHLDLSDNILSSFDEEFNVSMLVQLKHVILSSNNFTGALPVTLLRLPALQTLLIDSNDLSGSIPNAMDASVNRLAVLDLSQNRNLQGCLPIPESVSSNLTECNVRGTNISCVCGSHLSFCGLDPCDRRTNPTNVEPSSQFVTGDPEQTSQMSDTLKWSLVIIGILAAIAFVLFLVLVGTRVYRRYIAKEPWHNPESKLCWWV